MPINLDFGITQQALLVRARRAEMIAQNIANADTPGYKAVDVDFREVLRTFAATTEGSDAGEAPILRTTHRAHIQGDGFGPSDLMIDSLQPQYRVPSQPSLDGNTVDTQMEKAAFAENQLRYQASIQFLDDKVSGLKRAFRGN